jgi:threonylcarbamoyladenosine tRNA methylthiotransferase MtaB
MKTFLIKTFGCKVNQYESQEIREKFISAGYSEVGNDDIPSVCIINTCCVTENAERKSRHFINRIKRTYPNSEIIVTGCSVNLKSESFKKADFLIPNEKKDCILSVVEQCIKKIGIKEKGIAGFAGHTRAFVKIQDGCDQFCSYCIVPYVRGRSKSRDLEEIIAEVNRLVLSGYKEIVLTGVHLGDFDKFKQLIGYIDKIPELLRIRLSSVEPQNMNDSIIKSVIESSKICRHFHMPMQSGSDKILKSMNRKYKFSEYQEIVRDIQNRIPGTTFTTDMIVGFPGEDENDFIASCKAVNEIGFAKVHVFPYSKRPGTKAADFSGLISQSEIKRREKILEKEANLTAQKVRDNLIGSIQDVLIEKITGRYNGYTEGYVPVSIKKGLVQNAFQKIKIIGQNEVSLLGEVCS